jgi:hypothetical protein
MSVGYGRGHYGDEQLEPKKPRRWGKLLLIAGAGAGAWYLWKRWSRPQPQFVQTAALEQPHVEQPQRALEQPQVSRAEPPQLDLESIARSHGFSTIKDYEDSVVLNAKALKKSGAQVELASHLGHLKPRLV